MDKQHPAVWRAMNGLGLKVKEAATEVGFTRALIELINVRISQINGCAFCLDMHVKDAIKQGVGVQQLAVLPAWRETELFTDKERAVLALAECITGLPHPAVREHEEAFARRYLSNEEFSVAAWLAITINAFNRVSITSHHPVKPDKA
ncbi:carboxymuconolactone decarboxylase family protein [Pseudarthrobacter sp. J75]|uniref:carboxymuconolactone decarboxylase family protein n=1 Tax=unclassified Pseudarthrobacter TaxID=2647000 RepID=UPI002E7FE7C4|nr:MULTISPECIES: carboxymuconolactone decarboxylase family protein [unclassified Pseudarthrobacter]MEE2523743.1 carboxymuconolactone decarboxylase family protein [Pseudarthrobacter sp. J47]MEE2529909.1 carboxymuconolactone decarboxylase family protein [Pseudarthrobacter sp. J75]